jgi:YVTN family beta-propeller protein
MLHGACVQSRGRHAVGLCAVLLGALLVVPGAAEAGRRRPSHEKVGFQLFASPQNHPLALSNDRSLLYVANTTSDSVSIISTNLNVVLQTLEVGVEPVSVAVRPGTPDPQEVWVSNHVSDSVSVIDTNPGNSTFRRVVHTIQVVDPDGVTQFDEPVGIAFTSDGSKAYVALSSRNQVAVIDASTHAVTGTLQLTAQEPRALTVGSNGLLYVASFESGNQTQSSFCSQLFGSGTVGDECSLGLQELLTFITNPNLPGNVKNIVTVSTNPDRDLFVYNTSTDALVQAVQHVGTLLYGLAVDSAGRAYVTQTNARNAVNGDHGDVLGTLQNRIFDNQVAAVTCTAGGCGAVQIHNVEPSSPTHATALATPYGVALNGDESFLVATAAGTSRVFTIDTALSANPVIDTVDVGAIPRGLVFKPSAGAAGTAYVLNTLDDSVSVVPVDGAGALSAPTATIAVGNDPTPDAVRRGRIAFNNAFASDTGTFACASCHPDGNTDQLLWRIGGNCEDAGCDPGDEPRSTMPVRGLKNTLPLHWDGSLGDPFGGGNGAGGTGTNCTLSGGPNGDHGCFLQLVDASLGGVMCDPNKIGGCAAGGDQLSAQERDDMASFLASVSYPPARSRRADDTITTPADPVVVGPGCGSNCTADARDGFRDFFMDQGGNFGSDPDTCADSTAGCHKLPLGTVTNSATLANFDAPTMRGLTDRFIQFSMGPTEARQILALSDGGLNLQPIIPFVAQPVEQPLRWNNGANGYREETTFGAAFLAFQGVYGTRPLHIFEMVEEASTGYSGALGRQVTVSQETTTGGNLADTELIMSDLELADTRGLVNLRAVGVRNGVGVTLSFRGDEGNAVYKEGATELTHNDLVSEAQAGDLVLTLTGALRKNQGTTSAPQPLLGQGVGGTFGDPPLPLMSTSGSSNPPAFSVQGTDVRTDAIVFLDGAPVVGAAVTCTGDGGTPAFCVAGNIGIDLPSRPPAGLHLLQVLNDSGPISNELPFCVGSSTNCKTKGL